MNMTLEKAVTEVRCSYAMHRLAFNYDWKSAHAMVMDLRSHLSRIAQHRKSGLSFSQDAETKMRARLIGAEKALKETLK